METITYVITELVGVLIYFIIALIPTYAIIKLLDLIFTIILNARNKRIRQLIILEEIRNSRNHETVLQYHERIKAYGKIKRNNNKR